MKILITFFTLFMTSLAFANWPASLQVTGDVAMRHAGQDTMTATLIKKSENTTSAKYKGRATFGDNSTAKFNIELKRTKAGLLKFEGNLGSITLNSDKYTAAQFFTSPLNVEASIWQFRRDPFCYPNPHDTMCSDEYVQVDSGQATLKIEAK